jgi:anti-sigma factor RsiW
MIMKCNQAEPLIPSYLDGELSEAQAGPLRKHLLDCQPCRGTAQSGKNLKRWFVPEQGTAVPRDFASRVARRAFAGDRGERFSDVPSIAIAAQRGEDPNLRFVLQLTSLAAAVVIFLSLAIGSLKLPSGSKLEADSTREMKLEHAIEQLDRLNATESQPLGEHHGASTTQADRKDAGREQHPAAAKESAKGTSPQ